MKFYLRDFKVKIRDVQFTDNQPKWSDYFLSGFQGILDKFKLDSPAGKSSLFSRLNIKV